MNDPEWTCKALALMAGDLRDWPLECVHCGAPEGLLNWHHAHDIYHCDECGCSMTGQVAQQERVFRARVELLGVEAF